MTSTGSFHLFDGSFFLGIFGEKRYKFSVFIGSMKL